MSDCKNYKHLVMYDYKNKSYSCELGECEFEPEEQEPTTKNDLVGEFEGIEITYPPEEVCIYPEYKGKPYFAIKYKENGEEIVGYGTYNPEVLSQYLKDYFILTTKNDLKRHKQNIQAYAHDFGVSEDQAESELRVTTKNDLGVDCISRAEAIKCLECDFDITGKENMKTVVNYINSAHDKIVNLPRVKQEPFKPMVEIDLYSVIKQKYIEREVLDEIRAEISTVYESLDGYDPDSLGAFISKIDEIFDKYKAETEAER